MYDLSKPDLLRLLKFVCTFAWTDLEVQEEERAVVDRLIQESSLDAAETARVQGWLSVPPPPEEVDPLDIPVEHRQLFYDAVRHLVEADGRIAEGERDSLALFQELLHG